jgi:hypothetical protein
MRLKTPIVADLLVARTVGAIFAVIKEYNLAIFLSTSTTLALGTILSRKHEPHKRTRNSTYL